MNFLLSTYVLPTFDLVELFNLNQHMDFILLQQNHFKMILPEVFLATSILVITLHSSLLVTSRHFGFPLLVQSFSKLCILVLFLTFLVVQNNSLVFMLTYQNTFIFDLLTSNVKQILLVSTIFCLYISEETLLKQQINNFEYFILILCAILGLMFLVSSYDMISLYLAIEMQSLCLYVLAASKKDSSFSTEAGLKYFILGSFSSALLLFGISILYGCVGTTNFDSFYLFFSGLDSKTFLLSSLVEKALFCISAAFFFKIAAAPFHMWSPDVYEGSPTSSTIFFAVIPKIALFSIFLRLFQSIFNVFEETFLIALIFAAISSVIIGSFVALRQKKLKRLLAYSSISHVGYLLLAFAANSLEGTQSLFFYLIVYMLTSLCIWSVVLSLNTSMNQNKSKTLIDLASISNMNPLLGFTGMLAFFSLAGVPPLAGFFAKMEIFISALSSSLFFISFVAILSSVISSVYYIRLIKTMYFEPKKNNFFFPVTTSCSLTMGISILFLFFLFLNPSLLFLITQNMALCLF
jgi:NADH-quinone oxidoreductase subunit N